VLSSLTLIDVENLQKYSYILSVLTTCHDVIYNI